MKDGYLTIQAATTKNNDQKDEKTGNYIRRERYSGSCSRSFYVGEDITQKDIKAKYENGILVLAIPKKDQKKVEAEGEEIYCHQKDSDVGVYEEELFVADQYGSDRLSDTLYIALGLHDYRL